MSITFTPTSWPAVIIGAMIGIYWIKVLFLVAQTKRDVGRAANFVPPEPLGRLLRIIWIPVVVLWIAMPLALPFVLGLPSILAPLVYAGYDIVSWAAVGIALAAFAFTWVCWIKMGKSWRMGIDPSEKTKLVFNGPYAYVRHPIYGLSQVLMICALAAFPSPLMILVAVIHLAFMQWEVRREEVYLVRLHGSAYADYMQRVGRFVPRIGRWK